MATNRDIFRAAMRAAVAAGCAEWGYASVSEEYFATLDGRVPQDTQEAVGSGIRDGLISTDGYEFRVAGLPPGKGPYRLVGRGGARGPQPHWEYYLQLAEYIRLVRRFAGSGLSVAVEDGLMDVSVRRGRELLWCVEVKEKPHKLDQLLTAFDRYGPAVPMQESDRHNDGLRKSKYLVRHRPPFLSLLANGRRHDYAVRYPRPLGFELEGLETQAIEGDLLSA